MSATLLPLPARVRQNLEYFSGEGSEDSCRAVKEAVLRPRTPNSLLKLRASGTQMNASTTLQALDMLRRDHETTVPPQTIQAATLLEKAGMWHQFGRNSPAASCRDGAQRRTRLGSLGIPLWDEVKSLALTDGKTLALAHCRADQRIDLRAVSVALGLQELHMAPAEMLGAVGVGYGLVNPFADLTSALPQVFDTGLMTRLGTPGTVMTNSGDLTWCVEFFADELVDALPNAIIGEVTTGPIARPRGLIENRPIAIITGNGPESGMWLWQQVLDAVRAKLGRLNAGDVVLPEFRVVSIPQLGLSMELASRAPTVREALVAAVQECCEAGAVDIALACNTTQIFSDELEAICIEHGAAFLSAPRVVRRWIEQKGLTRVGLIGIRAVVEDSEWSAYRSTLGEVAELVVPSDQALQKIEELAYRVKETGPTERAYSRLQNLIRDELDVETTIVALSELSVLLKFGGRGVRRLVDAMEIYADALADRYTAPFIPRSRS